MTVWCAEIECKWNHGNQCTRKEINLSAGHIHTKHQGFKHTWECRNFEVSDEMREILQSIAEMLGKGETHEGSE